MDTHEWTVTYNVPTITTREGVTLIHDVRNTERVMADAWVVGTNGDLAFMNDLYSDEPFYVRAFAAGTWVEVSLYA